jgi:NAD+ synthase
MEAARRARGPDGEVIPQHHRQGALGGTAPNQKDQDSLPPYPVLDAILECLVENEMRVSTRSSAGFDRRR